MLKKISLILIFLFNLNLILSADLICVLDENVLNSKVSKCQVFVDNNTDEYFMMTSFLNGEKTIKKISH
jgi:hypothetical protein